MPSTPGSRPRSDPLPGLGRLDRGAGALDIGSNADAPAVLPAAALDQDGAIGRLDGPCGRFDGGDGRPAPRILAHAATPLADAHDGAALGELRPSSVVDRGRAARPSRSDVAVAVLLAVLLHTGLLIGLKAMRLPPPAEGGSEIPVEIVVEPRMTAGTPAAEPAPQREVDPPAAELPRSAEPLAAAESPPAALPDLSPDDALAAQPPGAPMAAPPADDATRALVQPAEPPPLVSAGAPEPSSPAGVEDRPPVARSAEAPAPAAMPPAEFVPQAAPAAPRPDTIELPPAAGPIARPAPAEPPETPASPPTADLQAARARETAAAAARQRAAELRAAAEAGAARVRRAAEAEARVTAANKAAAAKAAAAKAAHDAQRRAAAVAAPPGQEPADDGPSADAAGYGRAVLGRIMAMRRYPDAARERGAHGTAIVMFTIDASGEASGIALARSSGDAVLDAEAVATVRRASPFSPPPRGASRRFSAPLAFQVR